MMHDEWPGIYDEPGEELAERIDTTADWPESELVALTQEQIAAIRAGRSVVVSIKDEYLAVLCLKAT